MSAPGRATPRPSNTVPNRIFIRLAAIIMIPRPTVTPAKSDNPGATQRAMILINAEEKFVQWMVTNHTRAAINAVIVP